MKPFWKDYLISLICAAAFVSNFALYIFVSDIYFQRNFEHEIYSQTDWSSTMGESQRAGRSPQLYKLDIAGSEIQPAHILPDKEVWIERRSLSYFRMSMNGPGLPISDSMQNDFIVHVGKMLDDRSDRVCAVWKDGSNGAVLGETYSDYIHIIEACPDTLVVEMSKDELVYKGELWIVEEK